ncbi:MAG: GldG family protein [Spirochaetota bacterium]
MKMPDIDLGRLKERITSAAREASNERHQWLLSIVIIVLVNLIGLFLYFRIDLTANNAYSLSDVSRKIVSSLEEPLTIKVFFSNDLPAPYNAVSRYLSDLLEEYSQRGNRNFRYEFVDVEKNKDAAADFGVHPVQIREIKNDRVSARNAYMGIAVVHGDLIETIPSITEPEGVEYRITTLMQKMNGKIDSLLGLDRPITVTLYASSNLPISGMQNLAERVRATVQKANSRNYGRLEFRHVDPTADRASLDLADTYGLPRLKWPAFTGMDGRAVVPGEGMLGIVLEHQGRFETVQILARTVFGQYAVGGLEDLESRINGALDNLISINPRVGYVTGHGERDIHNQRDGAATFRELVADMYDLKTIDLLKEEIPADIQTIIINGPRSGFTDEELFKIDQFIMKGRSALFFIDSFAEIQPDGQNMFMREPAVVPVMTGIEKLLEHYGITVNRDIVLDEKCYQASMRGMGEQSLYFAPMIGSDGLSETSVITRYLKKIVFLKSSSLSIAPGDGAGIRAESLVSSSDRGWLMKGRISFMPWSMPPPDASRMGKYVLAAALTGDFPSYFAERGAPVAKAGAAAGPVATGTAVRRTVKPARIIVAGTSEITTPSLIDREGKTPNAVLAHNMIDFLAGNHDVPEMRSKGLELNPLRDTGDAMKLALKIFNIVVLPLLVVAAGLVVWRRRLSRRKRIMAEFAAEVNHE